MCAFPCKVLLSVFGKRVRTSYCTRLPLFSASLVVALGMLIKHYLPDKLNTLCGCLDLCSNAWPLPLWEIVEWRGYTIKLPPWRPVQLLPVLVIMDKARQACSWQRVCSPPRATAQCHQDQELHHSPLGKCSREIAALPGTASQCFHLHFFNHLLQTTGNNNDQGKAKFFQMGVQFSS